MTSSLRNAFTLLLRNVCSLLLRNCYIKVLFRQFNPSYSDYHSRQNSAASAGRDSRVSQTGTNHSIHSNLSEQSSLSQGICHKYESQV